MTKARDLSSLIGSSGQIDNTKITLDTNEIPSLDADKITSGSLGADRIPNLDTAKITTGTFADARMPSTVLNSNVDLTNLSASNLTSGTLPDARFPATLPAISGANLTNLPAGGATEKLYQSDISGSASYSLDIFDSTIYAQYRVYLTRYTTGSDGGYIQFRFRNSSGDITSSNYQWSYIQNYDFNTINVLGSSSADYVQLNNGSSSAQYVGNAIMDISGVLPESGSTQSRPYMHWKSFGWDGTTVRRYYNGAVQYNSLITATGFTLYSNGNFEGNLSIYGFKK